MNRSAVYAALLTLVLSAGCSLFTDPSETLVLEVAETRVACVGEGVRDCLVVRFGSSGESQLFYDEISGFEHTPGIRYQLLVERTEIENPPADGSSHAYRLERILWSEPSERADLLAEAAAAEAIWHDVRPVAYTMTEERICFCGSAGYGVVSIDVTRAFGQPSLEHVTAVTRVADGAAVPAEQALHFRSVQDLFREIRWAIADEVHSIDVSFDESAGYPTRVSIDRRSHVSDDEVEYAVGSVSGL